MLACASPLRAAGGESQLRLPQPLQVVDPVMKGHEDGGKMFFGMEEALPDTEVPGAFRRYP